MQAISSCQNEIGLISPCKTSAVFTEYWNYWW